MNPRPDTFPRVLVERETGEIQRGIASEFIEREARRITRKVLDAFWLDMGFAHNSASMQQMAGHPLHEYYHARSQANRERIARDRANEEKVRLAA